MIAAGTPDELARLEELFALRARPLPDAVSRLAERSVGAGRRAGRARAAERPGARRLRDERRAAARSARASSRRASWPRRSRRSGAALDEVERAEVAGPGFVNLWLAPAWYGAGAGRDAGGRSRLRRAAGRPSSASASRSRWSPRIRPGRSRSRAPGTARSATASRACSSSPGHEVEREYYYNDAGSQMELFRESVEAIRRGEEPPENGYQGEYVVDLARRRGRPGSEDARADRGDARALPDPLRLLGVAERARGAARRVPAAPRHVRARRRGLGALVRATATTTTAS